MAALRRRPRFEVPPFGENFANTVEQAQGDDPSIPEHADPTPTSSTHAASRAPDSFRSTSPAEAAISLAKVQKLEAQMATLLHHI